MPKEKDVKNAKVIQKNPLINQKMPESK